MMTFVTVTTVNLERPEDTTVQTVNINHVSRILKRDIDNVEYAEWHIDNAIINTLWITAKNIFDLRY